MPDYPSYGKEDKCFMYSIHAQGSRITLPTTSNQQNSMAGSAIAGILK